MKQNKYHTRFLCVTFNLGLIFSASWLLFSCNKEERVNTSSTKEFYNASTVKSAVSGRPNIVIILADDVGYDAIATNGNQSFQTPRIDQMGVDGMRFTQCHSAPTCSPSRFMFVTGKYSFRNYTSWGTMDPNEKTFANLLKDAGYATYVAGKWQFDGGQTSIANFGYNGYCVWDAQEAVPPGNIYKSPKYYENGAYSTKRTTSGQYGDDIFTSRVLSFINTNKANNFFVYYPIGLCHAPFSPTPDDSEFATWVGGSKYSNPVFFPSMVKYLDKKVGQIIDSLKAWELYNNTLFMFVGDNGTANDISYYYNGVLTKGGKLSTTESGTRAPLFVTWPNRITPGQVNNNLIDFTDLLPTVAEVAGCTIPSSYGKIDGKSFYNQLLGLSCTPRDWVFCHYLKFKETSRTSTVHRWMQNTNYKLYDSTGKFYNIVTDPGESNAIADAALTTSETLLKTQFQSAMDTLH